MSNYKQDDREEKHYTPIELIKDMEEILLNNYKGEVTEFLENSAGSGNLVDYLKKYNKPIIAFDINNETKREDIKECNYLKEKIDYKSGRVAFINPPFQKGLKFVYKSLKECDYCVTILSLNSLINIDYDKYDVDEIYLYRKYKFDYCDVDIIIIGIKNKN